MVKKIKTHSLGKLEIYIEPSHKIRHGERTLFRRLFPKSAYIHIIKEAKKDGIINATAHSTHMSFSSSGEMHTYNLDSDNSKLAMVVQLIDKKDKLQDFFLRHKDLLEKKAVIYKEVEFWDVD